VWRDGHSVSTHESTALALHDAATARAGAQSLPWGVPHRDSASDGQPSLRSWAVPAEFASLPCLATQPAGAAATRAHAGSQFPCTSDYAAAAACRRRPQWPSQLLRGCWEGLHGALVCLKEAADTRDSLLSQRPSSHRPAASFWPLLSALLLLAVVAGRSSRHGWISGFEKAYGELQFVSRRPLTPEIRCSRSALRRTGRQSTATLFSVHCCCWLWLQAVAAVTAGSAASRRPTGSFSLSRGDHIHPRYVALATLFQHCVDMPSSLNLWTKRSPFLANTHAAARATAQAVS